MGATGIYILSYFSSSGAPATGLSPTIRIRTLSNNALTVTNAACTEVGDGFYKYDFSSYDSEADYAYRVDGGSSLNNADRYKYNGNDLNVIEVAVKEIKKDNRKIWNFFRQVKDYNNDLLKKMADWRGGNDNKIDGVSSKVDGLATYKDIELLISAHIDATEKVIKSIEIPVPKAQDFSGIIKAMESSVSMLSTILVKLDTLSVPDAEKYSKSIRETISKSKKEISNLLNISQAMTVDIKDSIQSAIKQFSDVERRKLSDKIKLLQGLT